jgi:hypothetical protein
MSKAAIDAATRDYIVTPRLGACPCDRLKRLLRARSDGSSLTSARLRRASIACPAQPTARWSV